MKDKNLHFSVIIPTKDRDFYLAHTLRTCSMQDYDNFKIIVSDDGSSDRTKEVVMEAAAKDNRIVYISPGKNVGMKANFEFALNNVNPGFVIALGGDDGLLPYGIQGIRDEILATGKELVTWSSPIYSYANSRTKKSQLVIHKKTQSKIINSQVYLKRQAKNLSYITDPETPMFYVKGAVSSELIERVKSRSKNGMFYRCATPDGYSGIVLAGEVDSFAFSGTPFSLYGTSPSSQGLNYLLGDEDSRKQSNDFFKNVIDVPMHEDLASQPYSPLISLMTADYLLNAKALKGWPGQFPGIDYKSLLSKSLNELSHGLYAPERINRELRTLHSIAEQHNLVTFFENQAKRTQKYIQKSPYEGNGINLKSLFIDCDALGVKNICDAAYLTYNLNAISMKVNYRDIIVAIKNSILYKLKNIEKNGHLLCNKEKLIG